MVFVKFASDHMAPRCVGVADRRPHGLFKRRRFTVKRSVGLAAMFTGRAIISPRIMQRIGAVEQITVIGGKPKSEFKHS